MEEITRKRSVLQWFLLLAGLFAVGFYIVQMILIETQNMAYNSINVTMRDISFYNSGNSFIGVGNLYGVLNIIFATLICLFFIKKVNRTFRVGIYLWTIMSFLGCIGYAFFPAPVGTITGTASEVMFFIISGVIVLHILASLLLITVGLIRAENLKIMGYITLITLIAFSVGVVMVLTAPNFSYLFAERLTTYTLVIYTAVLSIFSFMYSEGENRRVAYAE